MARELFSVISCTSAEERRVERSKSRRSSRTLAAAVGSAASDASASHCASSSATRGLTWRSCTIVESIASCSARNAAAAGGMKVSWSHPSSEAAEPSVAASRVRRISSV